MTSLIIQQDGQQLAEQYFNGMERGESTNYKVGFEKYYFAAGVELLSRRGTSRALMNSIGPYFKD
ncbi:MAG: hypothetical protein U5J63_06800 [Fodinibius sp.]|nr:hypothetical protein [Fodinibius sp.]